MTSKIHRRTVIKTAAAGGVAAIAPWSFAQVAFD